jgi:hypothetical protein
MRSFSSSQGIIRKTLHLDHYKKDNISTLEPYIGMFFPTRRYPIAFLSSQRRALHRYVTSEHYVFRRHDVNPDDMVCQSNWRNVGL